MKNAAQYCKTLAAVSREELINALHQSLMQFNAIERGTESVDNKPIQSEISALLTKAGHIGFTQ